LGGVLGGVVQFRFESVWPGNPAWDVLPVLVWMIGLGIVMAVLPVRTKRRYGEPAPPEQLSPGESGSQDAVPATPRMPSGDRPNGEITAILGDTAASDLV